MHLLSSTPNNNNNENNINYKGDDDDDDEKEEDPSTVHHISKQSIDILYQFAKQLLRIKITNVESNQKQTQIHEFIHRILHFLMVGAFFDVSNYKSPIYDDNNGDNKKKKKNKKQKKKKKINESNDTTTTCHSMAQLFQSKIPEHHKFLNYDVRYKMASLFHSLVSDATTLFSSSSSSSSSLVPGSNDNNNNNNNNKKWDIILSFLKSLVQSWNTLKECGAIISLMKITSSNGRDEQQEQMKQSEKSLRTMYSLLINETNHENDNSVMNDDDYCSAVKKKRYRLVSGMSLLSTILYLHLLQPFPNEDQDNDDDDDEEEEVKEELHAFQSDILDITHSMISYTREEGEDDDKDATTNTKDNLNDEISNSLLTLADLSVTILSSTVGGGGNTKQKQFTFRSGSTKLIRDCVKFAWIGGLNVATIHDESTSSSSNGCYLNESVMSVLLEAICGTDGVEESEEGNDDDDEEMIEEESDIVNDEENKQGVSDVFTQVTSTDIEVNDNYDDSGSDEVMNEQEDNSDSDEEEELLDPSQFGNMLLDDDSDNENTNVLEHHRGADKALASLIRMKTEMRKAGRDAKEIIEIMNRRRCIVLLEGVYSVLLTSSTTKKNHKERKEDDRNIASRILFMSILPLLRTIGSLDKSIQRIMALKQQQQTSSFSSSSSSSIGLSERRSLLDRLSSLFKGKLCKTRIIIDTTTNTTNQLEEQLIKPIVIELKKGVSTSHKLLCNSSIIMILKSLDRTGTNNSQDRISFQQQRQVAKTIYVDEFLTEWSTKKGTKLNSTIFDDFVTKCPRYVGSLYSIYISTFFHTLTH